MQNVFLTRFSSICGWTVNLFQVNLEAKMGNRLFFSMSYFWPVWSDRERKSLAGYGKQVPNISLGKVIPIRVTFNYGRVPIYLSTRGCRKTASKSSQIKPTVVLCAPKAAIYLPMSCSPFVLRNSAAWNTVFGADENVVETKKNNCRTQYIQELVMSNEKRTSGRGSNPRHRVRWFNKYSRMFTLHAATENKKRKENQRISYQLNLPATN